MKKDRTLPSKVKWTKQPRQTYLETPNARFWHFHYPAMGDGYDGFVKITLRPDQELSWCRYFQNEEAAGCGFNATTWRYDADERLVCVNETTRQADCDGPHEHNIDLVCPVDRLQGHLFEVLDYQTEKVIRVIRRPSWQTKREYQRDHFAEAAGY